jgi:hypothetical protein
MDSAATSKVHGTYRLGGGRRGAVSSQGGQGQQGREGRQHGQADQENKKEKNKAKETSLGG